MKQVLLSEPPALGHGFEVGGLQLRSSRRGDVLRVECTRCGWGRSMAVGADGKVAEAEQLEVIGHRCREVSEEEALQRKLDAIPIQRFELGESIPKCRCGEPGIIRYREEYLCSLEHSQGSAVSSPPERIEVGMRVVEARGCARSWGARPEESMGEVTSVGLIFAGQREGTGSIRVKWPKLLGYADQPEVDYYFEDELKVVLS